MATDDLVTRIERLRRRIEEAKRAENEARGEYRALGKRLKEEHGVENMEEARALLKELNEKSAQLRKTVETLLAEAEALLLNTASTGGDDVVVEEEDNGDE